MAKSKLPRQQQGFTLVEVLVSILIATVFVATALQGMVIAALFKAKAQQYAEATTWIQQDLEAVRGQAAQLSMATALCSATTGGAGFANYLQSLPAFTSGFTRTTTSTPPTSVDTATKTSSTTSQRYTFTRASTVTDDAPNILKLTYNVVPQAGGTATANMYYEVIPDAALQCP